MYTSFPCPHSLLGTKDIASTMTVVNTNTCRRRLANIVHMYVINVKGVIHLCLESVYCFPVSVIFKTRLCIDSHFFNICTCVYIIYSK